jgi:beta-lactamase regulating signal transducer with metallopeptidase domain
MTGLMLLPLLRMSAVLVVAFAACALLRHRSAAVRASVLAAGLGAAALVPLLQLVAPSWGVDLGPSTPALELDSSARLLLAVWIAGLTAHLAVLLAGLVRLMGVAAAADPIRDGDAADLALDIAAEYRVHAPVLLLEADRPTLPVTWGHLQPKVLLPPAARQWSDERIRVVLRHEIAHVRRRDWLVQTTAAVVRSVYWFHPLVWIACSRLRLECERACDDAVLAGGIGGARYASHLLELARAFVDGQPAAAAPFAGRSTLELRVRAMLASHVDRSPVPRWCGRAVALLMLVVAMTSAGFGATTQQEIQATISPQPRRMTLLLDGRIMDLSKEWPTYPDPRAGLVAGPGLQPGLQRP